MSNEELTTESAEAQEPTPVTPKPAAGERKASTAKTSDRIHGLGRRKTAVARVALRPGEGSWKVNGRTLEEYFPRGILQQSIVRPLVVTETQGQYDVFVRVAGGGLHGQADAVRLGLSRALLKVDEEFRRRLRSEELLTRDAREVERKKPGRPKARKRFQFSKR
ncbi:MAG: 30S ribosomal protein S9 [Gemmatimonadota bacterium]